jgi:hypothetical protein
MVHRGKRSSFSAYQKPGERSGLRFRAFGALRTSNIPQLTFQRLRNAAASDTLACNSISCVEREHLFIRALLPVSGTILKSTATLTSLLSTWTSFVGREI